MNDTYSPISYVGYISFLTPASFGEFITIKMFTVSWAQIINIINELLSTYLFVATIAVIQQA